ncbi:MAG: cysteine desulfurase [Actinobacteria bacterium]|nr:cysteine desulfurase [Actinomycetota bacterium]
MPYLDYAASTPVLPEVTEAMVAVLRGDFGNPSSVHAYGRAAREIVEDARDRVATSVGASPAEIIFTGGGTEADNLAIKGAASKLRGNGDHVITSAFEHHAVLDSVEWLGRNGFEVTVLPVGADGIVDPDEVAAAVRPSTVVVSIMAVNNEIGTAQPVAAIGRAVKGVNPSTLVHTDAVQMIGNLPVDLHELGVDFAAFSAHKFGGPKGVGFLYARSHAPVEALLHGGGHEGGRRSGTLNVPGLAGLGSAAEIAAKEVDHKIERVGALRARLWAGIKDSIKGARLNGHPSKRVPGTLNVSISGADGETLLLLFDSAGIACSAGSACQSGAIDPSHVLLAIGVPRDIAAGSVRFSLGRESTDSDVDAVLEVLPGIVERARSVG